MRHPPRHPSPGRINEEGEPDRGQDEKERVGQPDEHGPGAAEEQRPPQSQFFLMYSERHHIDKKNGRHV